MSKRTHVSWLSAFVIAFATLTAGGLVPTAAQATDDPAGTPSAPQSFTATLRPGQLVADLSWAAPASSPASIIMGYHLYQNGVNVGNGFSGYTGETISGLEPGGSYEFTVVAYNGAGDGAPATASVNVPAVAPGAPVAFSVTLRAADLEADLSWDPPASDGGSPNQGYRVSVNGTDLADLPAGSTSTTLSGLQRGQSYQVTVRAFNAVGAGPAAAQSFNVPVVPPTVPQSFTVTIRANGTQADLSWAAPASDGGRAIQGYDGYVSGPGVAFQFDVPGNARSTTVSGLRRGNSYEFSVRAKNWVFGMFDGGYSPIVTKSVTVPVVPPDAPTIGRAVSGAKGGKSTADAYWVPPRIEGGADVDGYQVFAYQLNSAGTVVKTIGFGFLKNKEGQQHAQRLKLPKGKYKFAARAHNAKGWSVLSAMSNAVKAR